MKYKNPPVVEAIFDIQISPKGNFDIALLDDVYDQIKDVYPQIRKYYSTMFNNQIDSEEVKSEAIIVEERLGNIYISENKCRQVQFRNDGFTLNFLDTYSTWDDFHEEAKKLWEIYKSILLLESDYEISRIALRYLNKIMIPLPIKDFDEYITYMPPTLDIIEPKLRNFFIQIETPYNDEYILLLTETIESKINDRLPFILDIDISRKIQNKSFDIDSDFNKMREIKNKVFEHIITDKTRALFS